MNRKKYLGDSRYESVLITMDLLGITDVTTNRQHKNGTIVWKLPIKNNWKNGKPIEVASFSTGYVRNQNSGYSNYQLNKRCESEPDYYKIERNGETLYRKFTTRTCKLIPIEIDRLEYLISYCLKNYYIKRANQVADGKYVSQWYYDHMLENANSPTVTRNLKKISELHDRVYELESQVDVADTRVTNLKLQNEVLQNKLSNAISPTKYQCAINKLHDLENKLATIERIARINASYR
jgi:hypothetical protein